MIHSTVSDVYLYVVTDETTQNTAPNAAKVSGNQKSKRCGVVNRMGRIEIVWNAAMLAIIGSRPGDSG